MEDVLHVLPKPIQALLESYPPLQRNSIEEIRIRINRPLEVIISGCPIYPKKNDKMHIVSMEDAVHLLNKLSHYSLYALEEEVKRGYITIRGGHRVGLAGKVITEKGHVKAIKEIGSYNIRIARQKIGAAVPYVPFLYGKEWMNTLIVGPPQTGKTTFLRDLARIISSGDVKNNISSLKVGIVDERSEIAAAVKGVPQHDLGHRVDVLDACPKAEGMMMMIRSMSPDVLIVDEIGRQEDSEAILEAMNAGIKMIMTVHGNSLEDLYKRPTIRPLLEHTLFERIIELTREKTPGIIKRIRSSSGKDVTELKRMTVL
ncbi:stage III sporulation protein AA [Bacillus taeanensis]|uniref:Stage III sporulation protein AA n=1 Tax=Bacillus taeanensis TaxID=273032 RepID=A0A366XW22_9BACI|nr:stage III sporulation protein AA [Bacillus taeanensis]RBW70600.1 stage III sporulation protein AA [Bacillus taeanensis]